MPNANHSLEGRYLNDDLISYFYRIVNDIKMPLLNWKLNNDSIDVILDYNGNYSVSIWSAKNDESIILDTIVDNAGAIHQDEYFFLMN